MADLHEGEASLVNAGAEATIELPVVARRDDRGTDRFRAADALRCDARVRRHQVQNADGRLRSRAQYATVSIAVDTAGSRSRSTSTP